MKELKMKTKAGWIVPTVILVSLAIAAIFYIIAVYIYVFQ